MNSRGTDTVAIAIEEAYNVSQPTVIFVYPTYFDVSFLPIEDSSFK